MPLDWNLIVQALKEECDLMARLVATLERERLALTHNKIDVIRDSTNHKNALVPRLNEVQSRRRAAAQGAAKGLRSLAKAAPPEWAAELRALQRRAADLAEQVFLLNRGNGQLFMNGRNFLRQRMDAMRFRGGRVVLYGRQSKALSIGGASIIQRDL